MKILMVGNGFDLAHGLPTSYSNFLMAINELGKLDEEDDKKKTYIANVKISQQMKSLLIQFKNQHENGKLSIRQKELIKKAKKNFWIQYFNMNESRLKQKENWIDFEKEIKYVIVQVEKRLLTEKTIHDELQSDEFKKLGILEILSNKADITTFRQLIGFLEGELNNLTYYLEIYLDFFAEGCSVSKFSPDINQINFDKVLSFNYTNTYERYYNYNSNMEYDFIHGRICETSSVESCNLVLGIDEYSNEEGKNYFLAPFKKYYQRMFKENQHEYSKWIGEMKYDNNELFVFGHSLDETDKDILKSFLLNPCIKTTIFYLDNKMKRELINNLEKLIGYEQINQLVMGSPTRIFFVRQKPMEENPYVNPQKAKYYLEKLIISDKIIDYNWKAVEKCIVKENQNAFKSQEDILLLYEYCGDDYSLEHYINLAKKIPFQEEVKKFRPEMFSDSEKMIDICNTVNEDNLKRIKIEYIDGIKGLIEKEDIDNIYKVKIAFEISNTEWQEILMICLNKLTIDNMKDDSFLDKIKVLINQAGEEQFDVFVDIFSMSEMPANLKSRLIFMKRMLRKKNTDFL